MVLSVHILTYNSEKFLAQTLNSIVNQVTSFDYEVVIGDDASTDRSIEIIKEYQKKYPTLIYFEQNKTNLGILKNFVATLNRCRGKYVFDIAGDDWLHRTNALEIMVDALEKNPTFSFIDSGYDVFYEKKQTTKYFANKALITQPENIYLENCIVRGFPNVGCCYNKSKLIEIVDFNTYVKLDFSHEDYPIYMDLIHQTSFGRIPQSLTTYRAHRDSFSFNFEGFLNVRQYFVKKYNLSEQIEHQIKQAHYINQLMVAGVKGNSVEGKKYFNKISSKKIKFWIHFALSQSTLLRFLINPFRRV